MTDLTNKVENLNAETAKALILKYADVLKEVYKRDDPKVLYVAYIINVAYNYLEDKHKEESPDWKAWSIAMLYQLFNLEKIESKEDIFKHIDQFFEYKKTEYTKYVSNIAVYSDEYFRDCYFIDHYTKDIA